MNMSETLNIWDKLDVLHKVIIRIYPEVKADMNFDGNPAGGARGRPGNHQVITILPLHIMNVCPIHLMDGWSNNQQRQQ